MNIIIPLCGRGERFKKTHNLIKPLIPVFEKEIIFYILDNIYQSKIEKEIYIIINKNTNNTNIINLIISKYPEIKFIDIENETRGAIETVLIGLKYINNIKKFNNLLVLDGDNFYTDNVIDNIELSKNTILYFNDTSSLAQFSYISLNDNIVTDIIEKVKISNNANTGAYYFTNLDDFVNFGNYCLDNNIMFNNEFYISVLIKEMINQSKLFIGLEVLANNYISLGTPELVDKYINNTYAFLFDLDGTLIISDHIYLEVWKEILFKYNIYVNEDFFKLHIQGNTDIHVINKFLPNINVDEISQLKDEYFSKNLEKIIIIDGSLDFIKYVKHQGHKTAIVTNCNRLIAINIIKYLGIDNLIDLIIIGNECQRSKPYPEPYLKAIDYFKISNDKCFIFEDSNSGLLSAKGASPKCIIGINCFNNNCANIIINTYDENLYNNLMIYDNDNELILNKLKNNIYNSLKNKLDIKNITIDKENLKGGYISNVIKVDLLLNNDEIIKTIFKIENKLENNLSEMVKQLKLYDREYLLYENIYNHLNINIPKYYGIIRDDELNRIGIILENLNTDDFILNLNLNNETIDTTLIYINTIANMHIQFSNKDLQNKFNGLYKQNSTELNNQFIINFIRTNIDYFIKKWNFLLNDKLIRIINLIASKYDKIQNKLSEGLLTLCHGDFKSPNIFYKLNKQPYLIDWQYICEGKGSQDIIFFMIESFDSDFIKKYYNIIIDYYYYKIIDSDIKYSHADYLDDITYSISYFPLLVAIWFGNISQDELIDKNFPFIFIQKFLFFIDNYVNEDILVNL